MSAATQQFRDAIQSAGLIPPDVIEPGKFHKFPGEGKDGRNTAAWCKLFPDGMGGIYGDYSTGLSDDWQAARDKPFSATERETFKRQVAEARKQAEADLKERQAEAAGKALSIWNAAKPAPADHPYLTRKAIKASGARLHNDALVVPMRADGEIFSLQFIGTEGEKRFLTGGRVAGSYFSIGKPDGVMCICEGYATGATIHEATGYAVAVAFNAGNLEPVALALRAKFPDLRLIICADDDAQTPGNPGLSKATAAAKSAGALLALPDFGTARPPMVSDFNDQAALHGLDAVRRTIANATTPARGESQPEPDNAPDDDSGWPQPQPLAARVEPELYPLDALPDAIRAAVKEVAGFVKAPVPMVASSALAALSLAIQAHTDAKRAEKLHGPVGLFLLTIADSGERKSTCDGFFTKAIRDYEEAQAEAAKPILIDHKAAIDAWEAKRGGVKEKIRQLAKDNKSTAGMESDLRDLEHDKPESLRIPRLLYADATPEALAYGLAKHWPSGGVVSAEGGIVFGSHGMGKESVMRNLALLNQLWDGTSLTIDRRTSESFTVRGARLTIALQIQEATLRSFFDKTGALARGTGFLARFLVAWPESTQGFRPFTEPPDNWPHLAAFNRRIAAILDQPAPIDDDGALIPALLTLAPDAKTAWVNFHDAIESELASGGELYDVRDVASKAADNTARLAALFHVFDSKRSNCSSSNVTAESIESACRIVAWHLNESRRFFGGLALPAELADAARLDSWLIEYCRRERTHLVATREAQRLGPIRDKEKLTTALLELEELDRVRVTQEGRRKTIRVNPALLGVAS